MSGQAHIAARRPAGAGDPQCRQAHRVQGAARRRSGSTWSRPADLGLPEPDETGTTFIENARIKAHAAASAAGTDRAGRRFRPLRRCHRRPARRLHRQLGQQRPTAATTPSACAASRMRCRPPARSAPARAPRLVQRHALPRPSRWPRRALSSARSTAPWSGRRAATWASASIRCSCPMATTSPSARCRSSTKHSWAPRPGRPQPPRPRLRQVRRRRTGRRH